MHILASSTPALPNTASPSCREGHADPGMQAILSITPAAQESRRHVSQIYQYVRANASLPGGVSVMVPALLFFFSPTCMFLADWYAGRRLRASVRIWISDTSPDGGWNTTQRAAPHWELQVSPSVFLRFNWSFFFLDAWTVELVPGDGQLSLNNESRRTTASLTHTCQNF